LGKCFQKKRQTNKKAQGEYLLTCEFQERVSPEGSVPQSSHKTRRNLVEDEPVRNLSDLWEAGEKVRTAAIGKAREKKKTRRHERSFIRKKMIT